MYLVDEEAIPKTCVCGHELVTRRKYCPREIRTPEGDVDVCGQPLTNADRYKGCKP